MNNSTTQLCIAVLLTLVLALMVPLHLTAQTLDIIEQPIIEMPLEPINETPPEPVPIPMPTPEVLPIAVTIAQQQFSDDVEAYSQSHTLEETEAYAQSQLQNQIQNLNDAESPAVIANSGAELNMVAAPDERDCRRAREGTCQNNFEADLFTSGQVTMGVLGGCSAIARSSVYGLIGCGIAAMGVHGFGILSARSRRSGCINTAIYDCRREFPN